MRLGAAQKTPPFRLSGLYLITCPTHSPLSASAFDAPSGFPCAPMNRRCPECSPPQGYARIEAPLPARLVRCSSNACADRNHSYVAHTPNQGLKQRVDIPRLRRAAVKLGTPTAHAILRGTYAEGVQSVANPPPCHLCLRRPCLVPDDAIFQLQH
jgi:hypothetical protein